MIGLPLARAGLRQRRTLLLCWGLALAVVVLLYLPLYPSLADSLAAQYEALPEDVARGFGLTDTDAAGYAQSTVFGLLGSALVVVFAAAGGARALAGEERSGLLELYLSRAVSRQRLLAERAAQLVAELGALVAVVVVAVLVVSLAADLGFSVVQVLAAGAGMLGLGVLVAATGLATGAATGSRGVALGAAALVGAGGYLLGVVGDIAARPGLTRLSPYHWAYGHEPLRQGFDGAGPLLLLPLTAAGAYAVGAVVLRRRDLGT